MWSVIGAIAATCRLKVTTGVTCPIVRIHPAVVAQAAATAQLMLDGRFVLGVGSGEALNEHILGDRWPPVATRLAMLEEAVAVMRELWKGGTVTHQGSFYRVENARIYSCPDEAPPVLVSAFGPHALEVAARIGDGFIMVAERVPSGPDPERHLQALLAYREAGFDEIYINQIGPDQSGFLEFYNKELLSRFESLRLRSPS